MSEKPRPKDQEAKELIKAAKSGDLASLKRMASEGYCVDAADEFGDTALMYASAFGHREAQSWLLEQGPDVDARNNMGITALMDAAMYACWRSIEGLVEAGCNMDIGDKDGQTALMFVIEARAYNEAAVEACKKSLSILFKAGCLLDGVDREGRTAEVLARGKKYFDFTSMISAERERRELAKSVGESAPRAASLRV